jgi:hypothetical protein
MKNSDAGKPHSTPRPTNSSRPSLSRMVGALPLPPKLGKPPIARVMKPLLAAPPKPSMSKPHPPKPNKPASGVAGMRSVAGNLGSFSPRRPR